MALLHSSAASACVRGHHSIVTRASGWSNAALSACHDRLAHLIRTGNSDTPPKAASFPSDAASFGSLVPVTSRRKRSKSSSASALVFPLTALVINDAEAREIAQPEP